MVVFAVSTIAKSPALGKPHLWFVRQEFKSFSSSSRSAVKDAPQLQTSESDIIYSSFLFPLALGVDSTAMPVGIETRPSTYLHETQLPLGLRLL
jgi:hypothetical protein